MARLGPLRGKDRLDLLNELRRRYENSRSFKTRFLYWRKRYIWVVIVEGAKLFKRLMDVLLSITLLVVFSPLMLIIALLIKIPDGGPIFYVVDRVGRWGKEFKFPKFRTMKIGADAMKQKLADENVFKENEKFKMRKDPRVTYVGRFLRKSSLDELPQLWCVLTGTMTLVGPRPPLPEEVAKYTLEQRRRLDVVPGLTGLWQVSGRSEIPFKQQVQLDLEYIESQSIWLDIKILLKTIPAVIFGKGAY